MAFHPEERRCVTAYIDVVLRYSVSGVISDVPAGRAVPAAESSSSGPSRKISDEFPLLPGVEKESSGRPAPAPKRSGYASHVERPRPMAEDFPELPGLRPPPQVPDFSIQEDTDPIQKQAKKKNQRQKNVLLRSGGL